MTFQPALAMPLALGVLPLCLGGVMAAIVIAWLLPVPDKMLWKEIDSALGLPDHVVTCGEMARSDDHWSPLQREDTLNRLREADWKSAWPVRVPRWSSLSLCCLLVLSALIVARALTWQPVLVAGDPLLPVANAEALEELFKDWEKAAEIFEDPALRELLAQSEEFREQLREGKLSERDLLMELSKLEERLETLRAESMENSLEPAAGEMAEAFEGMDQMKALAAALRKADFARAAQLAQEQAEKLGQSGAQVPENAGSAGTQEKMREAAQALEENRQQDAASAMRQIQESAGQENAPKMGEGMKKLGESLSRESTQREARQRMSRQLSQIGACRQCLGDGRDMGEGLSLVPKLSDGKQGGLQAGTGSDPNREKDPTELDSTRTSEDLSGVAGFGESEVETFKADAPGKETTRPDRASGFAEYQKLSEEAITDESLPIAYRETLRRYFEAIRPAANP